MSAPIHPPNPRSLTLAEVIFISLASATNVGFDMLVSPAFIALFSHIIAGVFIMLPINFLFISLTKFVVDDKFGSLTLYMTIFGTISIPTSFFGAIPGIYKLFVGLTLGIVLDLLFLIRIKYIRPLVVGIMGSIFWWLFSFIIWTLFDFPYVAGFSNLFNALIDISTIIAIPVSGLSWDLVVFSTFCGLFSSLPSIAGSFAAMGLFKRIEPTAVYSRFKQRPN